MTTANRLMLTATMGLCCLWQSELFAKALDFENVRGGARLSSIDIDADSFDDTVGLGAFVEAPLDQRMRFGVALDLWTTEDRATEGYDLTDRAVSAYGKYNFIPIQSNDLVPYALGGFGLHYISMESFEDDSDELTASFDLGLGFEAKLTEFIALNGEMKFRNVNNHDYNDYGFGMIAKF